MARLRGGPPAGFPATAGLHPAVHRRHHLLIALDDELGVGGDLQIAGHCPRHGHGSVAEEAGEQRFIDVRRQGRRRRVGQRRGPADGHAHGHAGALLLVFGVVGRAGLVDLPVHAGAAAVKALQPVHAQVAEMKGQCVLGPGIVLVSPAQFIELSDGLSSQASVQVGLPAKFARTVW